MPEYEEIGARRELVEKVLSVDQEPLRRFLKPEIAAGSRGGARSSGVSRRIFPRPVAGLRSPASTRARPHRTPRRQRQARGLAIAVRVPRGEGLDPPRLGVRAPLRVKVKFWRSAKANVLRRAVTRRAGRFEPTWCTTPRRNGALAPRTLLQEVLADQGQLIPEPSRPIASGRARVYIFVQRTTPTGYA